MSAESRREAIVRAAAPLFAAKGFDAVTTREIAEAAQVSEALLYRHFAGKADLYVAIQQSCVADSTADAARIAALPDSTATLVLAVYLAMSSIQKREQLGERAADIPRLILRSLLTDGEFTRNFIASSAALWMSKVEGCIRAAIAAGDIEGDFDDVMGSTWFAHHVACAVVFYRLPGQTVAYPGGNDVDQLLDRSVRFALRGLGLTRAAIAKYYQPQAFALLRAAGGHG